MAGSLYKMCSDQTIFRCFITQRGQESSKEYIYSTTMPSAKYTLGRCRVEDILVVDGSNHVWKGLYTLVTYRCSATMLMYLSSLKRIVAGLMMLQL